jgi:hypothetical protein
MVATSSNTLRPLGKPARSPPSTPRLLGPDVVGGMAILSRNMSACVFPVKVWKLGTMPAGIPVNRIAAKSARGFWYAARLGKTPGYRLGSSAASPGLVTNEANCESRLGGCAFQKSFLAKGMRTS